MGGVRGADQVGFGFAGAPVVIHGQPVCAGASLGSASDASGAVVHDASATVDGAGGAEDLAGDASCEVFRVKGDRGASDCIL